VINVYLHLCCELDLSRLLRICITAVVMDFGDWCYLSSVTNSGGVWIVVGDRFAQG
jgi:hypothetical protein